MTHDDFVALVERLLPMGLLQIKAEGYEACFQPRAPTAPARLPIPKRDPEKMLTPEEEFDRHLEEYIP